MFMHSLTNINQITCVIIVLAYEGAMQSVRWLIRTTFWLTGLRHPVRFPPCHNHSSSRWILRGKTAEYKSVLSPRTNAEVKNAWSPTSTASVVLLGYLIKDVKGINRVSGQKGARSSLQEAAAAVILLPDKTQRLHSTGCSSPTNATTDIHRGGCWEENRGKVAKV